MTKRIYVIIVTWNGMKWIQKCLDALRKSTYPVTTLMIDNLSTDNTVEYVKENYPEVRVIQSDKNLGFGQANNIGMRIALKEIADYVYLLNQDAYVYPDMFQKLIEVAESDTDNQYGIFSPLHVRASGTKLDKQFKDYLKTVSPDIVEDSFLISTKKVYSVESVPAAGWLLPKKTLETIGGFDPIFFHYGEDVNYAQRLHYHGYKIGIVPSSMMIHDREEFGNESVYRKGEIQRIQEAYGFLDINLNTKQRWNKFVRSYSYFALDVIKGNYKMLPEYISSSFHMLCRISKYKTSREQNRKKGSNWL